MHILQVVTTQLPAVRYGGMERVVWSLARELTKMGHRVTFLARKGSTCDFARVAEINPARPLAMQIPPDVDIAHFHTGGGIFSDEERAAARVPLITTVHGNVSGPIGENAVFVSRNHAERHGAWAYVYNGLDWDDYELPGPEPSGARTYFHFLAKAAWRVKNVKGAIDIVRGMPGERLRVLGGTRLNFKMGFRFTPWPLPPRLTFCGMVDQRQKSRLMRHSRGLVFPVRWHEPFGLAMTESLWFGAPVFGTPYGSLPELIVPEVGALSASAAELRERMAAWASYSPRACHEYARDLFNARLMAERYLECYERVLAGEKLNPGVSEARNTGVRLPFFP